MTAEPFGAPVRRKEDLRLITGKGHYTDDMTLPGMLHAAILRSRHAHARIVEIDTAAAKEAPGVVAVFTAADLEGELGLLPTAWLPPDSDIKTVAHSPLATDRVRYVGDGVALVIAESRYQARDALDKIAVRYEPLRAVTDALQATHKDAPQLHEDAPANVAFHWRTGTDVSAAFETAEVVVRQRFRQQRLVPNPMEPRSALASYEGRTGELNVWLTSQNPHIHRLLLSGLLGLPEHKVRVVAPDVGGGFGCKIACYADEALVCFASKRLGRPVKWTEDRSEHFLATTHGRDQVEDVELAGTRDGKLTALRVRAVANMGAYLSTAAPGVPTILFGLMTVGAYTIPAAQVDVTGVFTNTTPVDAYRGAGRPEATFLIERMVDLFAHEIGADPVELRRRNLIPKEAFPYGTAFGLSYDSGDYHGALARAEDAIDIAAFRREQAEKRAQGQLLGIGFSTYVEMCGLGPSEIAGAVGFQGGLWESATVRVHPSAKVSVLTGIAPHGQGEGTTFAQVVASKLGVPLEDVEVVYGDTGRVSMGWGTYGSRSTAVGGSAVALAADKVAAKAKKIAAHMLEVSEEDLRFEDGVFSVVGSPSRKTTFQDVALQATLAWNLPPDVEPSLEAQSFYNPKNFCYPFGAHACIVAIDQESGEVRVQRYVAVDDCGPLINPMIVEGQVHGGIVQGIGQALWEEARYDELGQLVSGSFLDYAMPKAHFLPHFETLHTVTPAPHNPLGVKGVGETGTIASTPAVVNAVMDALAPFGIKDMEMPLTPEKIWRAIREGGHAS